jgi:hypothetical protein
MASPDADGRARNASRRCLARREHASVIAKDIEQEKNRTAMPCLRKATDASLSPRPAITLVGGLRLVGENWSTKKDAATPLGDRRACRIE